MGSDTDRTTRRGAYHPGGKGVPKEYQPARRWIVGERRGLYGTEIVTDPASGKRDLVGVIWTHMASYERRIQGREYVWPVEGGMEALSIAVAGPRMLEVLERLMSHIKTGAIRIVHTEGNDAFANEHVNNIQGVIAEATRQT